MREAARITRFGSVIPITGSDFVREVSQASTDVWVVVLLYKEGYFLSLILDFLSIHCSTIGSFLFRCL